MATVAELEVRVRVDPESVADASAIVKALEMLVSIVTIAGVVFTEDERATLDAGEAALKRAIRVEST